MSGKREIPEGLKILLEKDKALTKTIFDYFDKNYGYDKYRLHMKAMELSFHGVPWLAACFAMLYFGFSSYLWLNMLLLLVVDIVLVAIVKAFTRRRRPTVNQSDMIMTFGVDKFSFPSGHASRAIAIGLFFVLLYPLHFIFGLPVMLYSLAVSLSRIFLGRHHLLDVLGGILLAGVEILIMKLIWLSPEAAASWGKYLAFTEDPWSST